MFNKEVILEQSKLYDSFYLYDEGVILEYTGRLKRDFKNVKFLYSIKTNSNPFVVKSVLSEGFGVDAASAAEVMMGKENGVSKDKIQFSAPGKTKKDIEETIELSTIIADSLNEIMLINQVAQNMNVIAEIGIRVNPNFSFYTESGNASKFGIDEELLFKEMPNIIKLQYIKIIGLHVHIRSQELDARVLERYYSKLLKLTEAFQEVINQPIEFLNMGSGIGVPYTIEDTPLDTVSLGEVTSSMIDVFRLRFPNLKVYIETGRYVTLKCGVYVTKVVDKKISYGKTYIILKNTLNGFIRPSIAQMVMSYQESGILASSEPLFTGANALEIIALTAEIETEEVTLVGNLCTSTDVVAKDILLPKLQCGDVIVLTNAGSYAAVLSPIQFSSQEPPKQLFLSGQGKISMIND